MIWITLVSFFLALFATLRWVEHMVLFACRASTNRDAEISIVFSVLFAIFWTLFYWSRM